MLEIVQAVKAGYTTKIPIYHNDGTKLAVVKGSDVYPTEDGTKAGVTTRHPPGATICELNGRPVFEITRTSAAALKMSAELHTFDGSFLKWSAEALSLFDPQEHEIEIRGLFMQDCTIRDHDIGILLGKDGSTAIGASGRH